MPLHQHIAKLGSMLMDEVVSPVSLVNVINAGNHAGNRPARQEFVILPVGATSSRIAVLVLCLCRSKRDAASPVHRQARQQAHGFGCVALAMVQCDQCQTMQATAWPVRSS